MNLDIIQQILSEVGINIYHEGGQMKDFLLVWSELLDLWITLTGEEKAELLVNLELN